LYIQIYEYLTTNVAAKPVTFQHEINYGCTVVPSDAGEGWHGGGIAPTALSYVRAVCVFS